MKTARQVSRRGRASTGRVLAIPAFLLLASMAGLVLGLTGEGLRDAFSWALLSIPILLAGFAFSRRG